jgi:accessory gene regulator protein AgrB
MPFIEILAQKSAEYKVSKMKDYSKIEAIIYKRKNKVIKLTEKDVVSVLKYGYHMLYGTILQILIALTIALIFNIFVPVLIIMVTFAISRAFIGGKHLNSSNKCLLVTTTMVVTTGLIGSSIANIVTELILFKIVIYSIFGFILELISKTKYFEKLLNYLNKKK